MKKGLFFLTLIALLFTSCATIFTGTKDTLTFNSNPSGAGVYKDGIKICTTPCTIPLKRSINNVDIEFKLDGYQTKVITLNREFNVISVLNLLGLVGWGVDALTGSLMKYDQKTYDVNLEEKTANLIKDAHRIDIDTKKKALSIYVFNK